MKIYQYGKWMLLTYANANHDLVHDTFLGDRWFLGWDATDSYEWCKINNKLSVGIQRYHNGKFKDSN